MKAFVVVFGSPIQIGGPYLVVAVFWHDGDVHTVRVRLVASVLQNVVPFVSKKSIVSIKNFPVFPLEGLNVVRLAPVHLYVARVQLVKSFHVSRPIVSLVSFPQKGSPCLFFYGLVLFPNKPKYGIIVPAGSCVAATMPLPP